MKDIIKNQKIKNIVLLLLYLTAGILFFVLGARFIDFLESTLCFVMLILGFVLVIIYSLLSADDKIYSLLIYGIIFVVFGIFIFMFRNFFTIALSVLIGLGGVFSIIEALKLKAGKTGSWILELILGMIVSSISLALIVMSGTSVVKNILAIIFGITMIINALNYLFAVIKINNNIEQ